MDTHSETFKWDGVKDITDAQKEMIDLVAWNCPNIGLSINGTDAERSNLAHSEGVLEHLKGCFGPDKTYSLLDLAKLSEVRVKDVQGLNIPTCALSKRPVEYVQKWLADPLLVGPGVSEFLPMKGHRYRLYGLARLIACIAKRQALGDDLISQNVNVGEIGDSDYIWTKEDHKEFYFYKTEKEKETALARAALARGDTGSGSLAVETEEEVTHTPVPSASESHLASEDGAYMAYMAYHLKQHAKEEEDHIMAIKALLLARKLEAAQSIQEKKECIHKVEQFIITCPQ